MRPIALASALVAVLGVASLVAAQDTYTWKNSNGDAWLQGGNWNGPSGGTFPGVTPGFGGTASDEADFAAVLPNLNAVGIDMTIGSGGNTANQLLALGGISFQNNDFGLVIGNSSTTEAGVLRLNAISLPVPGPAYSNLILSNTSTSQTLTIQNTAELGTQSMTLVVPNDSRIFAGSGTTIVISTAISGSGRITSYGSGTLVLSGDNSYTNGTVVEQGTLRVANGSGSATGSGTVTVAAGAKLTGTGTIIPNTGTTAGNTVTVNGTIQPGTDAATGTLTIGSSSPNATVSVNSSGTYRWTVSNVGSPSTAPGGSSATSVQSELVVNGNLTFTPGTFEVVGLSVANFDNTQPYSWRVATGTAGVSIGSTQPTFSVTGLSTGGGSFYLSSGGTAVFLNYAPVPEPATVLLTCAAAAGIVQRIRRQSFAMTCFPKHGHSRSAAKRARRT